MDNFIDYIYINDILPKVKIDISEKSQNKLMSDIPSSTKKYVNAILNKDDVNQEVELRYIGDNGNNFPPFTISPSKRYV